MQSTKQKQQMVLREKNDIILWSKPAASQYGIVYFTEQCGVIMQNVYSICGFLFIIQMAEKASPRNYQKSYQYKDKGSTFCAVRRVVQRWWLAVVVWWYLHRWAPHPVEAIAKRELIPATRTALEVTLRDWTGGEEEVSRLIDNLGTSHLQRSTRQSIQTYHILE